MTKKNVKLQKSLIRVRLSKSTEMMLVLREKVLNEMNYISLYDDHHQLRFWQTKTSHPPV